MKFEKSPKKEDISSVVEKKEKSLLERFRSGMSKKLIMAFMAVTSFTSAFSQEKAGGPKEEFNVKTKEGSEYVIKFSENAQKLISIESATIEGLATRYYGKDNPKSIHEVQFFPQSGNFYLNKDENFNDNTLIFEDDPGNPMDSVVVSTDTVKVGSIKMVNLKINGYSSDGSSEDITISNGKFVSYTKTEPSN